MEACPDRAASLANGDSLENACHDVKPSRETPAMLEEVREGLLDRPRELPPKYFYDERGSLLFDRICDSADYYPMRAEAALLAEHAEEIIDRVRPAVIFELGSGTSRKTRHLLDACERLRCRSRYAPFDVCREIVIEAGAELRQRYGWLELEPLAGDYMAGLDNLPVFEEPALYVFLGGTIGNFEPQAAERFLGDLRGRMKPGDRLLIGADRLKDPNVLHAAYNDRDGITADFNMNVLRVINRDLGASFDESAFEHYACFNPHLSRIEMYLVAMQDQSVYVDALDRVIEFEEGEQILTEISRKFTRRSLEALLGAGGFGVERHFQAEDGYFSLVLARPEAPPAPGPD